MNSQERDTLLLGNETALYADAAYSSQQTRDKLKQWGIGDQVQRKGYRGNSLSEAERTRNYGLARTRFMGLAKNETVYKLAAMAANIRKGAKFLTLYGLLKPCFTG